MATILVQTTLREGEGEWQIDRFSSLVSLLHGDGHSVVARNRRPRADGSDPVLSSLDTSEFDELWLFAADRGNALAPADVRGILRFRERGSGIFTSRDSENIGVSLLNLGSVGHVNHFRTYNRQRRRRHEFGTAFDRAGEKSEYRRIVPLEPVHELLRSKRSPSGVIEYFPAHPQEGALSVPPHAPFARVIAMSTTTTGDTHNLAIAIENERAYDGRPCGRAVATSSLRHFENGRWNGHAGDPSEAFKDFARNIARWLAPSG